MKNRNAYSPRYLKMEAILLYRQVGSFIPSVRVPKKFLNIDSFFSGFSILSWLSFKLGSVSPPLSARYYLSTFESVSKRPRSGSFMNSRMAEPIATPIPPITANVLLHPI